MTILYISDFDLRGSGYMNIAVSLCRELVDRDWEVIALGLGYNGQEHHHPFSIVPVQNIFDLAPMVKGLADGGVRIEAVVVALDIPLQEKLLDQLGAPGELPYLGIFPLEAPPLCASWALSLLRMNARLVMSRFGQEALAAAGVDSVFIPIGVDTTSWRPPTAAERQTIRQGLGVGENDFVILTVADNQERKNLSRSLEIVVDFAQHQPTLYWLVTRPHSPVGWKLSDYALGLGIMDRVAMWERGLPFDRLWTLYAAADCLLLTSKAEGLAMPVLEAMACRLPVVGTRCCAIEEHLSEQRGLLIEPDYVLVDPFGNGRRYLAGRQAGVDRLNWLHHGLSDADRVAMLDRAQAYAARRSWDEAGKILHRSLERIGASSEFGVRSSEFGVLGF